MTLLKTYCCGRKSAEHRHSGSERERQKEAGQARVSAVNDQRYASVGKRKLKGKANIIFFSVMVQACLNKAGTFEQNSPVFE